jgi:hypothetical protein
MPKSNRAKTGLASIVALQADKKLCREGTVYVATWEARSWSSVHVTKVAARADIERVVCGSLPFHFPDLRLFYRDAVALKEIESIDRRFKALSKLVDIFLTAMNTRRMSTKGIHGTVVSPPLTPSMWARGRGDVAQLSQSDRSLLIEALGAQGDLKAHSMLPETRVAVKVSVSVCTIVMLY